MPSGYANNRPLSLRRYTGSVSIKPFDFSKRSKPTKTKTTPATLSEWAQAEAQIVHPTRGRIPFVAYPYQLELFRAIAAPRRIVLKARQIGMSQTFALEALYTAIHEPESTILFVSRSQDAAIHLLRYCYLTYAQLRHAPPLDKENEREMGLSNGSRIKSIPANQSTGRSFGARRVYLDEFAYADYAEFIYQSIAPTLSHGGSLTIGSTPNGRSNLFHDLFTGGEGFTRFIVPWHHCPAYYLPDEAARGVAPEDAAWYARERPSYTAAQWAAEYDCDFVTSGQAVFDADAIERAQDGAWGDVERQSGRLYLTSADIGRRHDATVINTFDITQEPYQRVQHERLDRAPYPVIQQRLEARAARYGGMLVVESNGIGDPVIENTRAAIEPFTTSAKSKVQAIQSLQLLLEHGRLKAVWTPQERKELLGYQWSDAGLVQDCVMSLAIGAVSIAQVGTPGV